MISHFDIHYKIASRYRTLQWKKLKRLSYLFENTWSYFRHCLNRILAVVLFSML